MYRVLDTPRRTELNRVLLLWNTLISRACWVEAFTSPRRDVRALKAVES